MLLKQWQEQMGSIIQYENSAADIWPWKNNEGETPSETFLHIHYKHRMCESNNMGIPMPQ